MFSAENWPIFDRNGGRLHVGIRSHPRAAQHRSPGPPDESISASGMLQSSLVQRATATSLSPLSRSDYRQHPTLLPALVEETNLALIAASQSPPGEAGMRTGN